MEFAVKVQCSICLKYYANCVTLICGHNFCRDCIDCVLHTQEASEDYLCTECGERFSIFPVIQSSNLPQQKGSEVTLKSEEPVTLKSEEPVTVKSEEPTTHTLCILPQQKGSEVTLKSEEPVTLKSEEPTTHTLCTPSTSPEIRKCSIHGKALEYYCVEDGYCICDFCRLDAKHWGHHLEKYSEVRFQRQGPTHSLSTSTTSPERRKCPVHGKALEYYCVEHDVCICDFCRLDWQHWGHQVKKVDEASEENLEITLKELLTRRREIQERIQSLYRDKQTIQIAASDKETKFNIQFRSITSRLEELKEMVLNDIHRQRQEASLLVEDMIRQLEKERGDLSMNIREKLCKKTGPPTSIQKPDIGHSWDVEEQMGEEYCKKREIPLLPNMSYMDVDKISHKLNKAVSQSYKVLERFRKRKSSFLQMEEAIWSSDADSKSSNKDAKSMGVSVTPSINGKTYSLYLRGDGLFCCSETKIQFQVRSTMYIEYQLESWSDHMTETMNNGYQVISPLFSLNIYGLSPVSAVYLPHCLSSKYYEPHKQHIKLVRFKDGKMILESPTRVETSYIVLENPTFSFFGAVLEKFWTFITRPLAFNGIVLIYGKAGRDYCLRLYTMIDNQPDLKRIIDASIGKEFRWIDKAPQVESVHTHREYVIQGLSDAEIEPEVLCFRYSCPSKLYPYTEITIKEPSHNIVLCIAEKGTGKVIWRRQLKKEQLENLKLPITPPATGARLFLQRNHENLCTRMGVIEPILLSLRQRGIINEYEEEEIKLESRKIEKRKILLKMIQSKGEEEQFYKILQENDPYLVMDLERIT